MVGRMLPSVPSILSHPLIEIAGPDGERRVRFRSPLLLAPMEGVTDRVFRDLVISLGGVGAACTEFIRISVSAVPKRVMRRYLGPVRDDCPVAVQLMAADTEHLAASVAAAEAAGAAWIDLNFGCPVPTVFNKCAGSGLLAHPDRLAAIVRTAVGATRLPVSAKIRAGINDPGNLGEIAAAAVEAGAAMLTVHARLRRQSYAEPATWAWLNQARLAVAGRIPLVGNGGVDVAADASRLLTETGCDAVMIGRAALADPWIFRQAAGGAPATLAEAADFALRYADAVEAEKGPRGAIAKLKQLVRWYRAGGIFADAEDERTRLLRCADLSEIRAWFRARQGSA